MIEISEENQHVNGGNDTPMNRTQVSRNSDDSAHFMNVRSIVQKIEQNNQELDRRLADRNPVSTAKGEMIPDKSILFPKEEEEELVSTAKGDMIPDRNLKTLFPEEEQESTADGEMIPDRKTLFPEEEQESTADGEMIPDRKTLFPKEEEEEQQQLSTADGGRIADRNRHFTEEVEEEKGIMNTTREIELIDDNADFAKEEDKNVEDEKVDKKDLFYKFFKRADTKNKGFFTISQFAAAVRKQGFSGKDSEIATMFVDLDANKDCEVSLEEYMEEMEKRDFRFLTEADWLVIFRKFDRNKDGYISREELQTTLEECGMRQLEIDMDQIMKKADKDGDGKLSFDDFIKTCHCKIH